jgi:magnesium-transporting ATPase (P-type)
MCLGIIFIDTNSNFRNFNELYFRANSNSTTLMNKNVSEIFVKIVIVILQLLFSFVFTLGIYMVLAITDYQGGFEGFVGIAIVQPIMGAIVCLLSILACFIVGLPIRLARTINNWWINHFWISVIGIVLGIILIIISFFPMFRESVKVNTEGIEGMKEIPSIVVLSSGWFVTTFFTLHIYPPSFIRIFLNKLAAKLFSQTLNVG